MEHGFGRGLRVVLKAVDGHADTAGKLVGIAEPRNCVFAREFAAARPGIAIGSSMGPLLSGRLLDHLAAHALNALVGNLDGPGGVLVPEANSSFLIIERFFR